MSPGVMIPILKYLICFSYHFLWEAERMAFELRNIPQNQPNKVMSLKAHIILAFAQERSGS